MKRGSRKQTKKKRSSRKAKPSSRRKVVRRTVRVASKRRARPRVRKTVRKVRTKARAKKRAPRRAKATRKVRARKPVRKVKTKALAVRKPAKKALVPKQETQVGVIQHYYTNLSVGVMEVTKGEVKVGDKIRIVGATTNFTQVVKSLQLEHESVARVIAGQSVGIKVSKHVREHDRVYKV